MLKTYKIRYEIVAVTIHYNKLHRCSLRLNGLTHFFLAEEQCYPDADLVHQIERDHDHKHGYQV